MKLGQFISQRTENYYGDKSPISMFEVEYTTDTNETKRSLVFRFEGKDNDDDMEIEMGEDCWYKVTYFNSDVRHFWIMVKWD